MAFHSDYNQWNTQVVNGHQTHLTTISKSQIGTISALSKDSIYITVIYIANKSIQPAASITVMIQRRDDGNPTGSCLHSTQHKSSRAHQSWERLFISGQGQGLAHLWEVFIQLDAPRFENPGRCVLEPGLIRAGFIGALFREEDLLVKSWTPALSVSENSQTWSLWEHGLNCSLVFFEAGQFKDVKMVNCSLDQL